MTGELVRTLLTVCAFLAFVAVVGFGAATLRGRTLNWPARTSPRLVLKNRLTLGDRSFVALVQLDDTELLVGGGINGVSLLLERPKVAREPGSGEVVVFPVTVSPVTVSPATVSAATAATARLRS